MNEEMIRLMAFVNRGIPIVVHPRLPLTRARMEPSTGRLVEVEALAWMIDGVIYVHPARIPLFHAAGINIPLTSPANNGSSETT